MIYKGGGVSKKEKDDYATAIRRNVIESMQVGELSGWYFGCHSLCLERVGLSIYIQEVVLQFLYVA